MGRNVTDMGLEKTAKKELKKHAATIHCSNTLSLLQRKISNALLYHAYKELMLKEEHEITVKQLCRLIGYQGNNHAAIRDAFKGLISTVIEWNLINDETGSENWTASSMLASVSLEGPLCYYAYSPRMKQLLHSPSMFGKIDLVIQSKFRSSYGLALYENCIRYRGLPRTKWFDMELFKKLMGVPAGKYDIFRDFKRRVLDKAIDEVNTYSDLFITSEYVKEGRKVVKVRFSLKDRAKKTRLGTRKAEQLTLVAGDEALKNQLLNVFSLSEEQIEQLLKEFDTSFILDKIGVIQASKPFKEGKIQNLAGYLMSALKHNYQFSKSKQNQLVHLHDAKLESELADLKKQIEGIRGEYTAYREKTIHAVIDGLNEKDKQSFMATFFHFAEPMVQTILQLQRKKYSRDNVMDAPQMQALLRRFALRELDDLLSLPSLDEYIAELDDQKRQAWHKLRSHDPEDSLLKYND